MQRKPCPGVAIEINSPAAISTTFDANSGTYVDKLNILSLSKKTLNGDKKSVYIRNKNK